MSEMRLQQCSLSFQVEDHPGPVGAIKNVLAILTHPNYGEVAELRAWHIDRRVFRGEYLVSIINDTAHELNFTREYTAVLDKWGEIKPWLVENSYHKGLGTWGKEINDGMLLFIDNISVHNELFEGHAESYILDLVIKSHLIGRRDYALMRKVERMYGAGPDSDITLFRKHYFRRVGRLAVLAYSGDPSHRSRRIQIADDIDPEPGYVLLTKDGLLTSDLEDSEYPLMQSRRIRLYPLHAILADPGNMSDDRLEAVIRQLHRRCPSVISEQDDIGCTPLFVAADKQLVRAVRTLLSLGASSDVNRRDNTTRLTALEECASRMLSKRETEEASNVFVGNDEAYLRISWLMKKAVDWPGLEQSEDAYIARWRWGCTCGSCRDGWYSRKMQQTIEHVATLMSNSDYLSPSIFGSDGVLPIGNLSKAKLDLTLAYLPPRLRIRLTLDFYKGHRSCLKAIMLVAARRIGSAPTCMAILGSALRDGILPEEEKTSMRFYLTNGGRLEYNIGMILDEAVRRSPISQYAFPGAVRLTLPFWDSLPPCKNDLEFEVARAKLCPEFKGKWAQYYSKDVHFIWIIFIASLMGGADEFHRTLSLCRSIKSQQMPSSFGKEILI